MAGYVDVYRTETFEGCINIASDRLQWMLAYLTECAKTSAVLQAQEGFDLCKDMVHSNYCTLVHYSDATVAEIGRLLIEGADPAHPFWVDGSRFFDPNYGPNQGLDPATEIKANQEWTQQAFRDVAALIERRLERAKKVGGGG